jgi:cytochrome oxidase Cu insertion factor (SCO1/SenC/PrrC family)
MAIALDAVPPKLLPPQHQTSASERRRATIAAVRIALLALAGSGCVTALHVTAPATIADHELAPPFTLTAQDGAPVSLASALASGPVALVFYRGSW